MSLYDGLDVDTGPKKSKAAENKGGKPDVSGWSAGIRMMQSHLRMKKAALTEAQRKIRGATLAPVVDLKKSSALQEEGPAMPPPSLSPPRPQYGGSKSVQSPFISAGPPLASVVSKEYDPAFPNEYEKVVKMLRDRRNKERDMERDRERENRRNRDRDDRGDRGDRGQRGDRRDRDPRERDIDRGDRPRSPRGFSRRPDSDEEDDDRDRRKRVASKAAIAPPSSLIMEDSVVTEDNFTPPPPPSGGRKTTIGDLMNRRKGGGGSYDPDPERSRTPPPGSRFEEPDDEYGRPSSSGSKPKSFQAPIGLGADSVAAKIMAKYGFREGSGLGKHEQGLSTALQVEKTSKRGGKIIESKAGNDPDAMTEPIMPPPMPSGPPKAANSGSDLTAVLKKPSKVVLLRNMVGPGEVDDDLQPETAEECSKYGPVAKVIIYEEPGAPADEAVRIFVEFHRIESAIKAVVDLNGRYFGGRIVKGGFYDPGKFSNLELNAKP